MNVRKGFLVIMMPHSMFPIEKFWILRVIQMTILCIMPKLLALTTDSVGVRIVVQTCLTVPLQVSSRATPPTLDS